MSDIEYDNKFDVTALVASEPIRVFNKNIIEFFVSYKENVKYTVHVSLSNTELAVYTDSFVHKNKFVDISGKIRLVPATQNYSAYILIHAKSIVIRDN